MSRNRFRLGKVFGIPLYIDASWLLILFWSLGAGARLFSQSISAVAHLARLSIR